MLFLLLGVCQRADVGVSDAETNLRENGVGADSTIHVGRNGTIEANELTVTILDALEKMVGFYSLKFREVNLDGIFGLRAIEGQLLNLLEGKKPSRGQNVCQRDRHGPNKASFSHLL